MEALQNLEMLCEVAHFILYTGLLFDRKSYTDRAIWTLGYVAHIYTRMEG